MYTIMSMYYNIVSTFFVILVKTVILHMNRDSMYLTKEKEKGRGVRDGWLMTSTHICLSFIGKVPKQETDCSYLGCIISNSKWSEALSENYTQLHVIHNTQSCNTVKTKFYKNTHLRNLLHITETIYFYHCNDSAVNFPVESSSL